MFSPCGLRFFREGKKIKKKIVQKQIRKMIDPTIRIYWIVGTKAVFFFLKKTKADFVIFLFAW